jgi:hypothetical protein
MKNLIVQFDRKFQLWLYLVGHSQLLLRSTKDEHHPTQIDVLFKDVGLMQIPAYFSKLIISEMSEKAFQSLGLSTGLLPPIDQKYFRLEGDNWQGVVVAGYVGWLEEDADHSAESKLISKVP